jgi:hypothetical protein
MSSMPVVSRQRIGGSSMASCSCCGPVSLGVCFRQLATSRRASPAGAVCDVGTRWASGSACSNRSWPSFKGLTRLIGIAPWWIALRCGHRAEARKQAPIQRIGAKREASTMYSPTLRAFRWPSFSPGPIGMMSHNCCPCWTGSLPSGADAAVRVRDRSNCKETGPMIRSRIARRSKKGDKTNLGKTSRPSWERVWKNALVRRADVGLAAQIRQAQDSHGAISFPT